MEELMININGVRVTKEQYKKIWEERNRHHNRLFNEIHGERAIKQLRGEPIPSFHSYIREIEAENMLHKENMRKLLRKFKEENKQVSE